MRMRSYTILSVTFALTCGGGAQATKPATLFNTLILLFKTAPRM